MKVHSSQEKVFRMRFLIPTASIPSVAWQMLSHNDCKRPSARNIPWQSWPCPIGTPPWCVSVNFLFHKVFVGVVWVHLMWSSNSSFHVGLESRISQAEGFFPIRVLLCPFWLPYCLNVLGQISQSDCLCNVLWVSSSSKFTSCIEAEADIRVLWHKICNLNCITSTCTCRHWKHGGNNYQNIIFAAWKIPRW